MNAPFLFSAGQAFLWSALDSIWQMGIISGFLALTNGMKSPDSASRRYNNALLLYFFGFLLFVSYFLLHFYSEISFSLRNFSLPIPGRYSVFQEFSAGIVQGSGIIYLILALGHMIRIADGLYRVRRLHRIETGLVPLFVSNTIRNWSEKLGLNKRVRLHISEKIGSPFTSGFWQPLIYLPATVCTGLTPRQLELLLVHELLHIQRNDFLVNLLLRIAHAFFFFNPFACSILESIESEREMAVDEQVIKTCGHPWDYATALMSLQKNAMYGQLVMNANSSKDPMLLMRIQRMAGKTPTRSKNRISGYAYLLFLCVIIYGPLSKTPDTNNAVATLPLPSVPVAEYPEITLRILQQPALRNDNSIPNLTADKASQRSSTKNNVLLTREETEQTMPLLEEEHFVRKIENTPPPFRTQSGMRLPRSYVYEGNKEKNTDANAEISVEPFIPSNSFDMGQFDFKFIDSAGCHNTGLNTTLQKVLMLREKLRSAELPEQQMRISEQLLKGMKLLKEKAPLKRRKIVEI